MRILIEAVGAIRIIKRVTKTRRDLASLIFKKLLLTVPVNIKK